MHHRHIAEMVHFGALWPRIRSAECWVLSMGPFFWLPFVPSCLLASGFFTFAPPVLTVAAMEIALLQSTLPLPVRRGKVRDVYDLRDALLIVATDRISAFDVVMPNGIPDKGRILTALSL